MKRCARCSVLKPSSEFNRSSHTLDGLQGYCRDCQKAHYRSNIVRHKANVARTRRARLLMLRGLVAERLSVGCADCGCTDLRVLQFDHVRGTKVDSVSTMVRWGRKLEAIVAEMIAARTSERGGRLIDKESSASMERKKREGYF